DRVDAGMNTVAQRKINNAILPAIMNRRLSQVLRQDAEPLAFSAGQQHRDRLLANHAHHAPCLVLFLPYVITQWFPSCTEKKIMVVMSMSDSVVTRNYWIKYSGNSGQSHYKKNKSVSPIVTRIARSFIYNTNKVQSLPQ